MRINPEVKQAWKTIEASLSKSARASAGSSRPTTPVDTFSAAPVSAQRHLSQVQQPFSSAAPRFGRADATRLVEALYQGALGRSLDPSGRESWVPLVEQGRLSEVVHHVLHSPEFSERAGRLDAAQLSASLYTGILGRSADAEGDVATRSAISGGQLTHRVFDILLSPEHRDLMSRAPQPSPAPTPTPAPTPAPTPSTLPAEPGPALATVPMRAEYAKIPVDTSSESAAVLSVARWVRTNKPEFFTGGENRKVAYEMMAWLIGALRAHGIDAHRVVNHPSLPVGEPHRYGSDALVMPSKTIFDVYASWGDPGRSEPHALNQGPYAPGRLRD